MYRVSTPEVIILNRVRENPLAAARLDRMLRAIAADRITEVDDDGLAEIMESRDWCGRPRRTGQFRMNRHPAIIFNAFRWRAPEEFRELEARYPVLRGAMLLGQGPWSLRDHTVFLREQQCVCQSAWEIHCAFGCLHACDYCHVPPYFNIMLNLEELAAKVREFGEMIPGQQLYKFDNHTDTICLEPEYGASEVMVRAFADWPGRYLLLYTKSDNVDHLLGLEHKGHTLISWSLSSETVAAKIEKGAPSSENRIRAIERCQQAGYGVRVRISPICPVKHWREEYEDLVERLLARTSPEIISVDVVGWMHPDQMKDALDIALFDEAYAATVERLAREGVRTNGKHLFPHEMRAELLRFVIGEITRRRPEQRVSLCMETTRMWRELGPLTGMTPTNYVCCCGPTSVPGNPLLAVKAHRVPPWTEDELQEVLTAYGLGTLMGSPEPMPDAGWDIQRASCQVRTQAGAWFLKKHHPAAVRRESHALIRAFQESGGLAPEIMAQPNGETWYCVGYADEGCLAEVHRIVPGQPVQRPTDAEALEAVEQVALFHRLPPELGPSAWTGWYDPSDVCRVAPEVADLLRSHGLPTHELQEIIEAETGARPPSSDVSMVVHGDLWRGNWLTSGGHIAALTDFDYVHRGDRIEDLADVLLAMCTDRDTEPGDEPMLAPDEPILRERLRAMVRRYEGMTSTLSKDERDRLPEAMRSMWLRHTVPVLHAHESELHVRVTLDKTLRFCRILPHIGWMIA